MAKLQELKLLYSSKGGLPAYVTKFRDAILDLEEAGKPMDPTLQKSMFLIKIQDHEYKHIVDSCIDDPNMSLEDCMVKLQSKFVRMTQTQSTGTSKRQANTAQSGSGNNHKGQTKRKDNIPYEKWVSMTKEERDAIIAKRAKQNGGKSGTMKKGKSGGKVPTSNYQKRVNKLVTALQASVRAFQESVDSEDEDQGSENEEVEHAEVKANKAKVNKAKSVPLEDAAEDSDEESNIVTMRSILKSSTKAKKSSTRTVKMANIRVIHVNQNCTRIKGSFQVVDGGANTSLMGPEYHILSTDTNRQVEVIGWDNNAKDNMCIGNGITAVDIPGCDTILLQVNEGVVLGSKGSSLLATNQARAFGHEVYDNPRKYGGRQCIKTVDGTIIPLMYRQGLTVLPVRKPTKWELDNLEPIMMTSPTPWDPENENDDDDDVSPDDLNEVLKAEDEEASLSGGHYMLNTIKKEHYDWAHIQKCLGYKPLEICTKTMKNTT